jgi:hypothetical protein
MVSQWPGRRSRAKGAVTVFKSLIEKFDGRAGIITGVVITVLFFRWAAHTWLLKWLFKLAFGV